jgi:hypothetical protein
MDIVKVLKIMRTYEKHNRELAKNTAFHEEKRENFKGRAAAWKEAANLLEQHAIGPDEEKEHA